MNDFHNCENCKDARGNSSDMLWLSCFEFMFWTQGSNRMYGDSHAVSSNFHGATSSAHCSPFLCSATVVMCSAFVFGILRWFGCTKCKGTPLSSKNTTPDKSLNVKAQSLTKFLKLNIARTPLEKEKQNIKIIRSGRSQVQDVNHSSIAASIIPKSLTWSGVVPTECSNVYLLSRAGQSRNKTFAFQYLLRACAHRTKRRSIELRSTHAVLPLIKYAERQASQQQIKIEWRRYSQQMYLSGLMCDNYTQRANYPLACHLVCQIPLRLTIALLWAYQKASSAQDYKVYAAGTSHIANKKDYTGTCGDKILQIWDGSSMSSTDLSESLESPEFEDEEDMIESPKEAPMLLPQQPCFGIYYEHVDRSDQQQDQGNDLADDWMLETFARFPRSLAHVENCAGHSVAVHNYASRYYCENPITNGRGNNTREEEDPDWIHLHSIPRPTEFSPSIFPSPASFMFHGVLTSVVKRGHNTLVHLWKSF